MKIKIALTWIVFLVLLDQGIKLIIYHYYVDTHFEIIPSLLEFTVVFNDKHSYLNSLLNKYFSLNLGLAIHLVIFILSAIVILAVYRCFRKVFEYKKLLDYAIVFQMAGIICGLIGNLIWEKGTLDYIYLKPLFVFDLKDLYVNCFVILFLISVLKNKKSMEKLTLKDLFS